MARDRRQLRGVERGGAGLAFFETWGKQATMYETILVTLDGTPSDRAIIEHIKQLAKLAHSRLVLLHVADGWAARTYGPDAVSPEIRQDTAYLEKVRAAQPSATCSNTRRLCASLASFLMCSMMTRSVAVPSRVTRMVSYMVAPFVPTTTCLINRSEVVSGHDLHRLLKTRIGRF